VAKTPRVRAKLEYKDMAEGSVVRFTFNPTEYTISATSSWKQTPGKGKEGPKSEFVGTLPQTISMDVLLSDKWKGEDLEDTVTLSYELRQMTKPTEKSIKNGNPSAPVLLFKWGPGVEMYECHLKSVSIKHTEFDERGDPTHAVASIVLERVASDTPKQNPTSGGPPGNRAHVVSAGDTLHSIAYREYDDPALWRGLADLNGIDDPMRLRPGQRLMVPPLQQVAARS
jgi:hypothetical protein